MKDSLERLSDLAHEVIAYSGEVLPVDHKLFNWKELFKTEKENVKKYMRKRCLKLADKKKISAFVDECRVQVIELSDFIYSEDAGKLLKTDSSKGLFMMKGLQRLLSYINNHFKDYVNAESKLPLYEIGIVQSQLELDYKKIRKKLKGKEDENLLNLLFLQLKELTISKEKLTSSIKYLRSFIEKFKEFTGHREQLEMDDYSLVDFLIAMNFNTTQLFLYITRNIKSHVDKRINLPEKLHVLALSKKKLKQGIQLSYDKLNTKTITTKEEVLNWINEEINALGGGLKTEINVLAEKNTKEKPKIWISVDVLGIVIKALKDLKIITGSDSMIAAFINENIETISGNSPSVKSMMNKIHQLETGSIAKAADIADEVKRKILSYYSRTKE